MDIYFLGGFDFYGFAKLSWSQVQGSIQGIRRRKHVKSAWLQCVP